MTFDINLQLPSFKLDTDTVDAWMRVNAGSNYLGASIDYDMSLHFSADPGLDIAAAIQAYWSGLSNSSPEAINYKSPDALESARATARTSAITKLTALGLSADEVSAILGS